MIHYEHFCLSHHSPHPRPAELHAGAIHLTPRPIAVNLRQWVPDTVLGGKMAVAENPQVETWG